MSDIDPAEVVVSASPLVQETFNQESAEIAQSPAGNKKAEREGLPPGYRMRADAHYVEHITSRRGEKPHAESIRAPADVPDRAERSDRPDKHDARERHEKVLAQLVEDLATIESAVGALGGDGSRISRRVNIDLIKSQVWRAAWSLRANAILDGSYRSQIRPRPLGFLLGQVRTGWAAECRLAGITLNVQASDWNAVVPTDEQGLIAGLTGALIATLGVIGPADGAVVTLSASAGSGELRTIDIVQDEVLVSPGDGGRFFDQTWTDRPGGWVAGLGAATAKAVARQHGGDAAFLAGERHGTTVRLQFR